MKITSVYSFFLFFCCFSISICLYAQKKTKNYTVSGYIKESKSKEYLPMVSIYLENGNTGTTTNDYGFYSLTLSPGKYNIVVSYVGFETKTFSLELSENKSLNFDLVPTNNELNEVVVNSNKAIKKSHITQMSRISLNPKDVKTLPTLLGEKDVIKTLQLLPGIQGGSEGTAGLYVRGGTPDQNLIILDEAPVYNSNHLFGMFSVFNGDALKSIDIFKGSFPARYGGRLSSVLKINTKNGNKEKIKGKFKIGILSSSATLEGPISKGKTSFMFSGRRSYADILLAPAINTESESQIFYFMDLNFKIHHIFNDKNKLYWSNYFGRDAFGSESNLEDTETLLHWGNLTSTLRWNHQFNDKFFANTSLIFSNYKFGVDYRESLESIDLKSGIDDLGAKIDFDYFPSPEHRVRFGIATTHHNFYPRQTKVVISNNTDQSFKQDIKSLESALYIEDDWKISNSFRFYPGIRLTHFEYKKTNYLNFEPRATLSWILKPDTALKMSYSKMNQYIHLLSNSGIGLPTDLWISSTDKIKPQTSEQYSIGLDKDFDNKGISLSVESYYKKLNNVISYKEGSSFILIDNLDSVKELNWEEDITSGEGWAYGTEILLKKNIGKLKGWFGYTISWSQRQFDEINNGKKFYALYDRRHNLSLVGTYKVNEKITLSGSWVFSSGNNFNLPDRISIKNPNSEFIDDFISDYKGYTTFNSERNNFKGENQHRLDLGIQFNKKFKKNRKRTWEFAIYNVYGRQNPFYYSFDDNDVLKKTSILQFIPTINYSYEF